MVDVAEVRGFIPKVNEKYKHTCYICGNEGFKPVGQGLYICYRDMCSFRDERGLYGDNLEKKVCYVCGKLGETHEYRGDYRGIKLYRCINDANCHHKLVTGGVNAIYTNEGVYKYVRGTPKTEVPVLMTDLELKELKQQELKERMEQAQNSDYKPTLLELVIIALQEKYYTIQELVDKFEANPGTIRSIVPYQIKKQGHTISSKLDEKKTMLYKLANPGDDDYGVVVQWGTSATKSKPNKIEGNQKVDETNAMPKEKKPYVMKIPASGMVFDMFELLKTGEFTKEEIIEKVGCAKGTVNMQLNYHMKNRDAINLVENNGKYKVIV